MFWRGIWCESLPVVWVIMGRRGVSQNAGVLVCTYLHLIGFCDCSRPNMKQHLHNHMLDEGFNIHRSHKNEIKFDFKYLFQNLSRLSSVFLWIGITVLLVYVLSTSNISHTLVRNKIVDHSDVVGASPIGAANYIFIPDLTPGMDWSRTTAKRDVKHLSFGIWCALY